VLYAVAPPPINFQVKQDVELEILEIITTYYSIFLTEN